MVNVMMVDIGGEDINPQHVRLIDLKRILNLNWMSLSYEKKYILTQVDSM